MEQKLRQLYHRHRELISYGFFGVLTTLVNYLAYHLCIFFIPFPSHAVDWSTVIAWVASVLFAYLTNRVWVFQSKAKSARQMLEELGAFVSARAFSGVLDLAVMHMAVERGGMNGSVVKLLSNILVVIVNYLLSKFWIFRAKPKE